MSELLKPIHSSDALIARAVELAKLGRKKTIAVAAAQDADVIGAVVEGQSEGFLDGILVGDAEKIKRLANEKGISLGRVELINEPDVLKAAHQAVKLASDGVAQAVMKGFLPTSMLLKTVLDRRYNLRGPNTLSHCALLDIPQYHKILNFTDGGMVVRPDQEQKFQILENAVVVSRALGLSPVKVAISSAADWPSEKLPHTMRDIDSLLPRIREQLPDVVAQGSVSLDLAVSKEAAAFYGAAGPVIGDADIYLTDSIEEGNIVAKALILFANAVFSGVIVGARTPVSLVSRTDTMKNKKSSLALACVLADYYAANEMRDGERL